MKTPKRLLFSLIIVIVLRQISLAQTTILPYVKGAIRPKRDAKTMNDSLLAIYQRWQNFYIKSVPGTDQSFMLFVDKNQTGFCCTSEGQGYAMSIVALMAPFDNAQTHVTTGCCLTGCVIVREEV